MNARDALDLDALAGLYADRAAGPAQDDPGLYSAYWYVVAGGGGRPGA